MSKVKVFKFGGASVKDAAGVRNVFSIINQYRSDQLLVVVSAMGKTTNALEKVVKAYYERDEAVHTLFAEVKQQHYAIMQELFPPEHEIFPQINDTFVEIDWVIEEEPQDSFDYLYDQIVSIGEMVSTKIVAAYLNQEGEKTQWLDARDAIRTDNTYREGRVDWKTTQQLMQQAVMPLFEQYPVVLTQGFIGGTSENFTTTLGREGSDFTAAIFSYCLDSETMSIWKDVPGILTADPRLFEQVTKIDRLSYKEAIEMTYYGAKVIHPKTIKPLQNKNIPLHVKSFLNPDAPGTVISDDAEGPYPPVVVVETDQVLLHISTRDFSFVAEHHLSHLFSLFARHRLKVNLMQNMAISFSVSLTNRSDRIAQLLEELEADFVVRKEEPLELLTIRHYTKPLIKELVDGKMILIEKRIGRTVQMGVSEIPVMRRKK